MPRTILALSAALALVAAPALAADSKPGQSAGQASAAGAGSVSKVGQDFLKKAAMTDMAEKQMAQLALHKASSDQVKSYAQQMIHDHSQSTQKLMPIASGEGVKPPSQLDKEHQATLKRLEGLSGAAFDREYMQVQVQAHQKAIDLYKRAAEQADDQEIQSFAEATLPTLKEHLADARQVVAALPDRGTAAGASKTR